MLFTTDKQTLDDLHIFGRHGSGSIYSLFNRTITVNGAAVLEEMFHHPLSDANAINQRSAIIGYLASVQLSFPFSSELFDQAEQYLADTDERTKLALEKPSFEKKLQNLIAADAAYKTIYSGITALVSITQLLKDFLKTHFQSPDSPFQKDKETVDLILLLSKEPFNDLPEESMKGKLSYEKVAAYDKLLRFQHPGAVRKMLRFVYQMDAYTAVAKVAGERGFTLPKALTREHDNTLIDGFYHPQLKGAVPNSLEITDGGHVFFLTGANMAGKSTLMKSLGIAMYLAHMGFPVAARKMEFPVLDGIYTTINLPDNLGIGASHFYAEVLRIKKIAKELSIGKKIFVIFDELFRGTNVKDAYEATIAVTAAFAKKQDSIFVISTHIIEAGDILKERSPNIIFKFLPTTMLGNEPRYTYTLENGITADRHGMLIIHNEGILDILKSGINKSKQS